jgi:hypothetical protein
MIDIFAFMWEAALFFVMSRALAPAHWMTYYGSVVMLLWVDSFWGLVAAKLHAVPIEPWIYLNFGFGAIVGTMLFMHSHLSDRVATVVGAVAILIRTALDYYTTWDFYFP